MRWNKSLILISHYTTLLTLLQMCKQQLPRCSQYDNPKNVLLFPYRKLIQVLSYEEQKVRIYLLSRSHFTEKKTLPIVTLALSLLSKPKDPSFLSEILASIISTRTSFTSSSTLTHLVPRFHVAYLFIFVKQLLVHSCLCLLKMLASYYIHKHTQITSNHLIFLKKKPRSKFQYPLCVRLL